MVAEALRLVAEDLPVLPLLHQMLSWGVRQNIEVIQFPDNGNPLRFAQVR